MCYFLWADEHMPGKMAVRTEYGLDFNLTCPFGLAPLCSEQPAQLFFLTLFLATSSTTSLRWSVLSVNVVSLSPVHS